MAVMERNVTNVRCLAKVVIFTDVLCTVFNLELSISIGRRDQTYLSDFL